MNGFKTSNTAETLQLIHKQRVAIKVLEDALSHYTKDFEDLYNLMVILLNRHPNRTITILDSEQTVLNFIEEYKIDQKRQKDSLKLTLMHIAD